MATKRKPNAKRGRPEMDPFDDRDADLLADILVRIASEKKANWDGKGWSSPPWTAIREELEARCGRKISASQTRKEDDDLVPGNGGGLVTARGRMSALFKRVNDLESAYRAHQRGPLDPEGRVFAMANIRRWIPGASSRLSSATREQVVAHAHEAVNLLGLACFHRDLTGAEGLRSILQQGEARMKDLAAVPGHPPAEN